MNTQATTDIPAIAANMREVTKDEFFAALYADPRDIMPRIERPYPYTSEWRNQKSFRQELFGVSRENRYWLT